MSTQSPPNRSKIVKLLILAGILVVIIGGSVAAITFKSSTAFLGAEGVILQKSKNDCGIAAAKNVVRKFGYEPNGIDTLLKATQTSGVNLLEIKRALQAYDLAASGYKTTIQEIHTLSLPMIAHWEGNHFEVVEEIHDGDITVIDPAMGRVRYSKSKFAEHWTGIVLSVQRAPQKQ
jgi:ABC-type bacteriocin/lantibiotic exporter with double-glycine peptidase domain